MVDSGQYKPGTLGGGEFDLHARDQEQSVRCQHFARVKQPITESDQLVCTSGRLKEIAR